MGRRPLLLLLVLAACDQPAAPVLDRTPAVATPVVAPDTVDVRGVSRATARIEPVGGGGVSGTVRLAQAAGGTRVRVSLDGLRGTGRYSLQILHGRDCDADPAVHLGAADRTPHGAMGRPAGDRHAGDLGMIRARDGRGLYDRIDPVLRLDGTRSAVGRAAVVRAGVDDGATQPDGAAGPVVGCGVLQPGR